MKLFEITIENFELRKFIAINAKDRQEAIIKAKEAFSEAGYGGITNISCRELK